MPASPVTREITVKPGDKATLACWNVGNWTPTERLMITPIIKGCLPAGQFWRENKPQVQLLVGPGLNDTPGFVCMDLLFSLLSRKRSEKPPTGDDSWAKYWKMICQEDRARRASKVQGPDTQEKQVLETLIISELGLGGPGMKTSRCWSRWGLVSYFSNLGLYPPS